MQKYWAAQGKVWNPNWGAKEKAQYWQQRAESEERRRQEEEENEIRWKKEQEDEEAAKRQQEEEKRQLEEKQRLEVMVGAITQSLQQVLHPRQGPAAAEPERTRTKKRRAKAPKEHRKEKLREKEAKVAKMENALQEKTSW